MSGPCKWCGIDQLACLGFAAVAGREETIPGGVAWFLIKHGLTKAVSRVMFRRGDIGKTRKTVRQTKSFAFQY
jgi:hypothetical protein